MSQPPFPSAPPSVFDPRFRRSLAEQDEPATAGEAEWSGPWRVERLDGRWAVLRCWESRALGHPPEALFAERLWAELCAVLLPALGRVSGFALGDREELGFPVIASASRGSQILGWLRHGTAEIPDAFATVEALRHSPVALAQLLLSIGPSGLEQVGQILAARISSEEKGRGERS
jgi:hypothetical protein